MKRFKTKQEFIQEYGKDFSVDVVWNRSGSMDYLFGCVYDRAIPAGTISKEYAQHLATISNSWVVDDNMLTDDPHPYLNGKYVIEVPEVKRDAVQAKAKACGFRWISELTKDCFSPFNKKFLFIYNGVLTQGNLKISDFTLLTFDQFMNGDIPLPESENKITHIAIINDSNNEFITCETMDVYNEVHTRDMSWEFFNKIVQQGAEVISTSKFVNRFCKQLESTNESTIWKQWGININKDYVRVGCRAMLWEVYIELEIILEEYFETYDNLSKEDFNELINFIHDKKKKENL